ncbi:MULTISPECIES: NAD kinase [unclassified Lactococcus]|uniref:NAD kinase n=1 Tax=unclassified Lactococcus TaxID=2643510 RepID=UPI0011CA5A27|nr:MULTISPECIES: NAD kinase [unclassified Lactococcus]MQW23526.1 NAD kinase [Lactococcus sp. dk101]TXK37856.1 NAD kinase [Lactococcus sp. dk310]TXK49286.1 NAD kinase [Lactococcus sp. dk322]
MNFGKKIWLIGNPSEKSTKTVNALKKLLRAEHFIFDDINPEIVVSVGGDGTLLRAMHMYEYQLDKVRFLGVHTGHLGFYTDFTDDELFEVVEALQNENFREAVHYPLVKVQVNFDDGYQIVRHVLNESTIRRASKTMLGDVKISDYLFERFRGDGLSISTPTGSTAYNKSIGGAVMHPRVEAMQIAEIASLNNRVYRTLGSPMIVAKKDVITVIPAREDDYSLTFDQLTFEYKNIKSIEYSMDGATIAFANCAHTPFWERVKTSFIGEVE